MSPTTPPFNHLHCPLPTLQFLCILTSCHHLQDSTPPLACICLHSSYSPPIPAKSPVSCLLHNCSPVTVSLDCQPHSRQQECPFLSNPSSLLQHAQRFPEIKLLRGFSLQARAPEREAGLNFGGKLRGQRRPTPAGAAPAYRSARPITAAILPLG